MKKDKSGMTTLVEGYNKMMEDPKAYAETVYKRQVATSGGPGWPKAKPGSKQSKESI